jgi:hypothetical protein
MALSRVGGNAYSHHTAEGASSRTLSDIIILYARPLAFCVFYTAAPAAYAHMTYANSHALNLYYFLTISLRSWDVLNKGKKNYYKLAPRQGAKSVCALEYIYFLVDRCLRVGYV